MKSSASLALAHWALVLALVVALVLALRPSPATPASSCASAPVHGAEQVTLCVATDLFKAERPQLQTIMKQPPGAAPLSLAVSSHCSLHDGPAVCTITLRIASPQPQAHSQTNEEQQTYDDAQKPPTRSRPAAEINRSRTGNRPPVAQENSQYHHGDHKEHDRDTLSGPPGISGQPQRLSRIKLYQERQHSETNPLLDPQAEHIRHLYHQSIPEPQPKPSLEPVCQSQPWWRQRAQSQIHQCIASQTLKQTASVDSNLHPFPQEQTKYVTEQQETNSHQMSDGEYLQQPLAKAEPQKESHQYESEPKSAPDSEQNEFSYKPTEEPANYKQYQPEQLFDHPPPFSTVREYQPQQNTQEHAPAANAQKELQTTHQRTFHDEQESGTLTRKQTQSVRTPSNVHYQNCLKTQLQGNAGQEESESHPTLLDKKISPTIQADSKPTSQHQAPMQESASQPSEIPYERRIPNTSPSPHNKRSTSKATTSKWCTPCFNPWTYTPFLATDFSQCNEQTKIRCCC